jgi:hypothetical protein
MSDMVFTAKSSIAVQSRLSEILDLSILLLLPSVLKVLIHDEDHLHFLVIAQSMIYMYCISKLKSITTRKTCQNICQVQLLHFGIQIEENVLFHGKDKQVALPNKVLQFVPWENVLDVIVAEVVFSYKVFSMVAFRIHEEGTERRSYEERIKEASLLPAFDPSKVSMTYKECLHTWKGINDAIVNR